MGGPEKRVPGQSNSAYDKSGRDPNADFAGTHSLVGGGDPTWVFRLLDALSRWRQRRRVV